MEKHRQALRTAIIVAAVVLAVTVLLVVLFFGGSRQEAYEPITLPEAPVTTPEEEPQPAESDQNPFAVVTRENVQDVLRSLAMPSSYHQKLVIITYAGSSSRQQQADIWRSGDLLRADLSDDYGVKSILTDGKTLYLWYDGDETAISMPLRAGISAEELLGIPTYETVLTLDPSQIEETDFVTLQDQSQFACIYVSFSSGGCTQSVWVDVASGLLCRQTVLQGDTQLYTLQQIQLELLIDGDETLSGAFCLPDGTEPFA